MTRALLAALTVLLPSALACPLNAQAAPRAKVVHAALAGDWTGTLRYRDYQDSTRFVSLPTLITGTAAADSSNVRLAFTYDDGPGKTVRSTDTFALDGAAQTLTWGPADGKRAPSRFSVQSLRGDKPLTLVAETDGEDDDRKARIRETVTVGPSELRILKEVRFAPDAPWLFRHEYRLTRSG